LKSYSRRIGNLERYLYSVGFTRVKEGLKRVGGGIRRNPGKTVATGIWEGVWGAWNYAYQTVISNPYNAAKLSVGKIAENSRLFPWPYNEVGIGPFNVNIPRLLEPSEQIVHYVFGNPAVRIVIISLPLALWGVYAYKKHRDAKRTGKKKNEDCMGGVSIYAYNIY